MTRTAARSRNARAARALVVLCGLYALAFLFLSPWRGQFWFLWVSGLAIFVMAAWFVHKRDAAS
jgi:hypothetical protein